MTPPRSAPLPGAAPRGHAGVPEAHEALARHREALKARFPLPPEALGPLPAPPEGRQRLQAGGWVAAVLLSVAAVVGIDPAWRTEHIATGPGQRQRIELADGSRLELDAGTRVQVSRHLRSRQVVLDSGRALFDVAPSTWRPFTVQAGDTRVRVVGTVFDVRRRGPQGQDVTVTVLQGRVEVQGRAEQHAVLGPGDRVSAAAGDLAPAQRATDTQAAMAWRDGRMVFERTPLPEVLAEIAHYGGLSIQGGDEPALAGLAVSGVYRAENAEQLLALLPSLLPVRVERDGQRVRIGPRGVGEKNRP